MKTANPSMQKPNNGERITVILTGAKLVKMGREIWGPEWAAVLHDKLKLTKKTLYRWRDKPDHAIPASVRDEIMRLVEDQLHTTGKWVDEYHADNLDAA